MSKKLIIISVIGIVILGLVVYFVNQNTDPLNQPLKIGILLPLSGDGALFGEKAKMGFDLAIGQYSPDKVQFIYEDTGGYEVKGAVTAANKLISVDKVDIIVGPYGNEQALGVVPLTKDNQIPIFSFSLCSKSFIPYKNLFCGYPSSDQQLATAFPFIQKRGIKSISLVLEQSDFGQETETVMSGSADKTGYAIVTNEFIQANDKDFRTIIAKISQAQPDAVLVAVVDPGQAFNFFKQLYDFGYRGIRIAYIDIDPKYLKEYGKAVEGIYVPGALPSNYSPTFTNSFKARYNEYPDLYSAIAYDILSIVMKTAEANGWSADKLVSKVINKTIPNSAVPNTKFLSDRTVSFPLELWVSQDGQYVKAEY